MTTEDIELESIWTSAFERDPDGTRTLAQEAIGIGLNLLSVLEEGSMSALRGVGACRELGEVFAPEMIRTDGSARDRMAVPQLLHEPDAPIGANTTRES